jgi:hypothetical protein
MASNIIVTKLAIKEARPFAFVPNSGSRKAVASGKAINKGNGILIP